MMLENGPQFLTLRVRRILNLQIAALCGHHLCREPTLGVPPAGVSLPSLDGLDFVPVLLVLQLDIAEVGRHRAHGSGAKV